MSADVIAKKYAKSLFEVSYQKGSTGESAQQLVEISKAFSKDVVAFFKNPFNSLDQKIATAKAALEGKASPEIFNFIILLVENDRIGLIQDISKELVSLVQSSAGVTKGKLFSSADVSDEFLKQVEEKVSKALNKKVELLFEKDLSLIAGYKVEVGGWTLDDSAQAHLKNLKDELMKRGL